jgi:hypothetical protein
MGCSRHAAATEFCSAALPQNPVSILLPNIVQIILDKLAVLHKEKRQRGGSRLDSRESLR